MNYVGRVCRIILYIYIYIYIIYIYIYIYITGLILYELRRQGMAKYIYYRFNTIAEL